MAVLVTWCNITCCVLLLPTAQLPVGWKLHLLPWDRRQRVQFCHDPGRGPLHRGRTGAVGRRVWEPAKRVSAWAVLEACVQSGNWVNGEWHYIFAAYLGKIVAVIKSVTVSNQWLWMLGANKSRKPRRNSLGNSVTEVFNEKSCACRLYTDFK